MKTLTFMLTGALALAAFVPSLARQDAQPPGSIATTGEAVVMVVPDEIILTLGVETQDQRLSVAKTQNDARVRKVIAAAQAHGVAAQHIQTDFISIEPVYDDYVDRIEDPIGYRVGKTIVITLRDMSQFDGLLADALQAGANYVHGIEFRTTELRKYRDQARELAIQAAQEKAAALAKAAGRSLGTATSISEGYSGWSSSYGRWRASWRGASSQNVIQESGGAAFVSEGGTAPGQIRVEASISVTFELR